jgi:hypothetical protein
MAVLTPFFDVVAGVAILAGRSSLLDTVSLKQQTTILLSVNSSR